MRCRVNFLKIQRQKPKLYPYLESSGNKVSFSKLLFIFSLIKIYSLETIGREFKPQKNYKSLWVMRRLSYAFTTKVSQLRPAPFISFWVRDFHTVPFLSPISIYRSLVLHSRVGWFRLITQEHFHEFSVNFSWKLPRAMWHRKSISRYNF